MPFRISYLEDLNIVELLYFGHVTSDDIYNATRKSLETQNKKNTKLTLVNTLEMTETTANIIDVHLIPEKFYKQSADTRKKVIAILESNIPTIKLLINDYFNSCYNRGWRIKKFKTRQDALEWLLQFESK